MPEQSSLNDLLWERISEVLKEQHRDYSDLWDRVARNKNTYTSWRKKRIIPRINDLEELASALKVSPADLLRPSEGKLTATTPEQIELPFAPGSKGVTLELQTTSQAFILRLLDRSA